MCKALAIFSYNSLLLLLQGVIRYVLLEIENMQKAKETVAAATLTSRETRKREISTVFKLVLRSAEKYGGQVKSTLLLNHVMEIMKGEYSCAAFGTTYSNVLLKSILSIRKHWIEIPQKMWHELLVLYCHLFLDTNCTVHRSIVARLLHVMMKGASRQCDLQPKTKKLLLFFTEVFKNIKEQKSMPVLESVMAALNVFVENIAPNSRVQICKLGEGAMPGLIYLWNNYPSDALRDDMVEFLRVQMQAHHPGGAKTVDAGGFAVDSDVWKSHLRRLYEVIHADIDQLGGRQKFASGSGTVVMKDSYIELAADICHQLYTADSGVIEVTQLPTTTQQHTGTPAKKRRVMSGWSAMLDTIVTKANTPQMTPWLQLLGCVLDKYPASLLEMDGMYVLQALQQVLTTCKGSEMYKHIFSCLASLARSVKQVELQSRIRDTMTPVWLQVWSSGLSLISSRQAETDGYQQYGFELLSTMLQCGLVKPGRQVWNLFLPDVTHPTPFSLTFLSHLLSTCHLPENYQPDILGSGFATEKGAFPLRKHLLNWVTLCLTSRDDIGIERTRTLGGDLAQLLLQLVLRDPGQFSRGDKVERGFVTSLEKIYLLTTFDCELDFEKQRKKTGVTTESEVCHAIPALVIFLGETLQSIVLQHLEYTEPQLKTLELLAIDCSILSHCLKTSKQHSITLAVVDTLLRQLLIKLTSLFSEYTKKEGTVGLLPVIQNLESMLSFKETTTLACYQTAEIIRSFVPARLIDLLLDLVNKKLVRSTSGTKSIFKSDPNSLPRLNPASSSRGRNSSRLMDDFDDFDDFGTTETSAWDEEEEEAMDMGFNCMSDGGESQEGEEGQQERSAVCTSLLDEQTLSDNQVLRNSIVHFLCLLTGYDRRSAPGEVTAPSFDIMTTKSGIEDVLNEDKFDPSQSADIQMMQQMTQTLLSADHHVTDTDLENVMDVLRRVAKAQRQDQEVCCLVLSLVALAAPHLADPDDLPSQTRLDCREILLHLISAFWRLQSEGNYNSHVRLSLAKCMGVIAQHDPEGQWGSLKLARQASDDDDDGVAMPTVANKFPHCLIDGSLVVRLFMASTMKRLFVTEDGGRQKPKQQQQQHEAFDLIYEICNNMMDIQCRLSVERQQDERWNRMASLLLALANAAMSSPVCEKKALFALCQVIQEKNVDIALVSKITRKMSSALGYETSSDYLSCHLPFVVNQWLDLDYALTAFPHRLLECNGLKHFYNDHTKVLVPQLFVHKCSDTLADLAQKLELSVVDVLRNCLPSILVHILPVFATSKIQSSGSNVPGTQQQLRNATTCYDLLVKQLGKETIDKSIEHQLGNIVVNILSCLTLERENDTQDGCDPEPNPPSYSEDTVRSTLDYLTQSFSGNTRSLVGVLSKTPDGLEQVLLELCLMMWRELRVHERLRCLQMFQLVVTMMLQELAATQLGGAWAFVLRRVIATLLHLLKPESRAEKSGEDFGYQDSITLVGLSVMKQVCTAIVECCAEEMGKYLRSIVDVVTQLALQDGDIGEMSVELLKFLLLDNADVIHTVIASLDPLPQRTAFNRMTKHCERIQQKAGHKSFQKSIDQVIEVSRDASQPTHSFARRLALLSQSVDGNREQLQHLLTETEGSAQTSQLISELLQLTQSTVAAVAEEAGRCLGAIGPVNLKTASLSRPQSSAGLSQALAVYRGTSSEKYCYVFHYLHQYLIDPSVEVVRMASMTLKKLLATAAGLQFSTDYKDRLANKDFLFQYLHPFRPGKQVMSPQSSGTAQNLQQFHDHVGIGELWEAEHTDHSRWIIDLCVALLQSGAVTDPILALLQPVCQSKVEFSEMLLPYLVHEILIPGHPDHRELLSQRISGFFHTHCDLTSSQSARSSSDDQAKSICVNKDSVRVMLRVVNFLRTQKRPAKGPRHVVTAWDNNFWLDLNYLDVAWAAHNCAAHFSAVLLAEIWWEANRESEPAAANDSNEPSQNCMDVQSQTSSLFSEGSADDRAGIQTLLLEALRSIGDPDAVYGCGAGSLPDPTSRVETYLHEKRWEKAVVTLDIQMQQPTPYTQLQLLKTVQKFGGEYLVGACLQGIQETSQPDMTELQYQAAWKAGQWDLDVPPLSDGAAPLHQSLYSCLHAVRDGQPAMAVGILHSSRSNLLRTFDKNLESCRSLYPLLSQLQCLHQFELLVNALSSDDKTEALGTLLTHWQNDNLTPEGAEFEFLEPTYSLRVAAVRLLAAKDIHSDAQMALQDILLHTTKAARKAGYYQVAEKYIHELQHQTDISPTTSLHTQLQLAQLFWARREQTTAKHVLKALIKTCQQLGEENREALRLQTKSLSLYGNWLAETRSETPTVIMEQYLEKTVQLLESSQDNCGQEAVEGYLSLARFADTQYQNIVDHMSSPTFEAKRDLMNKAAAEYNKYSEGGQVQKDRYLRTLEKQSKIDEEEVAAMIEDRKRFLQHAVCCYASCLQRGDTHDLRIFRLTSLWFDNNTSPEVNEVLEKCSQKLKSYKFLPLMHQLAARMSTKVKDNRLFLPTLNKILERAAVDHPHHTLWVLLALAHANKDEEVVSQGQSSKRRGKLATGKNANMETEDRVEAAQKFLAGLKSKSKVAHIVRDMEMVSTAYIQLANWPVQEYSKEIKPVPLPKTLQLTSIKDLKNVAVPSLEIKVDPSCTYDNIVWVVGFQPTFRLAGGVNLPKIIACRCSDGRDRRQLVKGRDDIRQDAIMQQVFSLVNELLSCDPAASSRQLHIRTYKVVPLSRRSGLLEWCEGTQPIGEYLVGSPGAKGSGAHSRYRPKDWSFMECRKHMHTAANVSNAETKYKVYMEACQQFQPVFRFFFMENFPDPAHWFQRRLAYTHSVATNSIVGYILGLGDRHVMNILIDCATAELIHIDLGIAFEQGHILPTPETVPFRLTRDIVDGMGVTGVEGVFRRCCEKTMEVMRGNQESLMTIVQVLLHDPLSEWTLSPQRAYALQGRRERRDSDTSDNNVSVADTELDVERDKSGGNGPVNKLAERVLLRLRQKLQGLEDGVALSVAGQVNHLIQKSRDPHNLSKLYAGWQPYI
ncbi:serine-protein kinase ATM-like [Littorina saxatilis]|uniref:serine-protein kinase ATM-like n=1 Tax=Littorina saxatilis TaxID=31220 RepID=UPI0038B54751